MNNLFVDLGFEYVGPLNGHDINELEKVFDHVKKLPRPVVIHVVTKKGKGFSPAENDPARFHGIGPLCLDEGKVEKIDTTSFTEAFGTAIVNLAETHPNIAAVTAAMTKGTGLETFARNFKNRFFDVGIAEQHAVTFGAGLAAGGMIPVICIYSTFIQRSVDQIIHDAALQKLHMIFVFDRAGVVPDDGETHQGLFDLALLRPIPNISIMTPAGAFDLELCLTWAVDKAKTPVVIRYPKLSCPSDTDEFSNPIEEGKGIFIPCTSFAPTLAPAENAKVEKKVLLICTGGFYSETLSAARLLLMKDVVTDIYVLRFIKPIDTYDIWRVCKNYGAAVIAEDGVKTGGVGEYVENFLLKQGMKTVKVKAFPDCFLSQGTRSEICSDSGMSPEDIAAAALDCLLEGKK